MWLNLLLILLIVIIGSTSFASPAFASRYWKVINEANSHYTVKVPDVETLSPGQSSKYIWSGYHDRFDINGVGYVKFQGSPYVSSSYDLDYLLAYGIDGSRKGFLPALLKVNGDSLLDIHIGPDYIRLADGYYPGSEFFAEGGPMRESKLCNLFH
ncbi:MAG TPA: hypothetical protein V6D26_06415 [Stenomitos sp.]